MNQSIKHKIKEATNRHYVEAVHSLDMMNSVSEDQFKRSCESFALLGLEIAIELLDSKEYAKWILDRALTGKPHPAANFLKEKMVREST